MPAISYQQIDTIFIPWAKARGLNVYTECKESEIRTTRIYDSQMNEYDLGVSPDYDTDEDLVVVGSCLLKRSDKKHTFYRERKNYDFRSKVALADLESALDESFSWIDRWSAQLAAIKEAQQDAS
jgi:hypothetical protein